MLNYLLRNRCACSGNNHGGGICIENSGSINMNFVNNTISGNHADNGGGGIYVSSTSGIPQLSFLNDIIYGNIASQGADIFNYLNSASISMSYSDIGTTFGSYNNGSGNLSTDPLFVNPSSNDFHLSSTSPVIDKGTALGAPTTDIEGNPRPSGQGIDIGAYEYTTLKTLTVSKLGTGSGTVTSSDGKISCGVSCSSQFPLNQVMTLSACPSRGGVIFSGWSGDADCADGIVTLSADKSCTATFTQCNPTSIAMTGGLAGVFGSINAAYAGAASTDTIKIIASNQQENLVFSSKNLTLEGGYDCAFTETPASFTTITGSLTISGNDSAVISGIRIQ